MDIAEFDLDLLASAADLTEFPESVSSGSAVRVERGKPTRFTAKIGDHTYEFDWTLIGGKLTRVSQLVNPYQNRAGQYNLLTGAMAGVTAQLTVIDGDNKMDVDDFIFQTLNLMLSEAGSPTINIDQYEGFKNALNIDWHKPLGLVFQHFAAHHRKMNDLFDALLEMGAEDITASVPADRRRRIERIIRHEPGIDVSWMEVGSVSLDPERNPRQQGFQDFLTSVLTNTSRLIAGYTQVAKKRAQLDSGTLKVDEAEALREEIRVEQNNLRQWVNNWGGAQRQMIPNDDGTFSWNGAWGATNVPCGRFGLSVPIFEEVTEDDMTFKRRKVTAKLDADGIPERNEDGTLIKVPASRNVDFDVWKTQAEGDPDADPPAPASAQVVDTTASVDEEV